MLPESKKFTCNPSKKSHHVIRVKSNWAVCHLVPVSAIKKYEPQLEGEMVFNLNFKSLKKQIVKKCFFSPSTKVPGDHHSRHDPVNLSISSLAHQS